MKLKSLKAALLPALVFLLALGCPFDSGEPSIAGVWDSEGGLVRLGFTEEGFHTAATFAQRGLDEATYVVQTEEIPYVLERRWYKLLGEEIDPPIRTYAIFQIVGNTLTLGTNDYDQVGETENGELGYISEPESNRPSSFGAADAVVEYRRVVTE